MANFKVLRDHIGDKPYSRGDTRTAIAADVAHLVDGGVLVPVAAKRAARPANKAAALSRNKSAAAPVKAD